MAAAGGILAVFRRLRGRNVLVVWALSLEMAFCLFTRSVEHYPRCIRSRRQPRDTRLHTGLINHLRRLFLRQDHHRGIHRSSGCFSWRVSSSLSLLSLFADAPIRGWLELDAVLGHGGRG